MGRKKYKFKQQIIRSSPCTSVTLGEGVGYIDLHAFRGCTGLTDLSIPDSLKIIEDHAFANCNLSDDETIEKIKTINPKALERYIFD